MLWRSKNSRIKEYKKIRRIGRGLTSQMFRIVPKEVLMRTAKDMNILQKGIFVFDSEEEGT